MVGMVKVNNPLSKYHGKRKYARLKPCRQMKDGQKYYYFNHCILPEKLIKIIK